MKHICAWLSGLVLAVGVSALPYAQSESLTASDIWGKRVPKWLSAQLTPESGGGNRKALSTITGGIDMKARCVVRGAVLLGAVLACEARLQAQTDRDISTQRETLERIQAMERVRREAADFSIYEGIEGGPISLAEVLADPDNVTLAYRYARTQMAEGNLRGAAATLERILALDPQLHRVRLLHAAVLYRLDSIDEARAALAQVDAAALSNVDRERVQDLAERIERRARRTAYHAILAGGVTYQTNANLAPDSGRIDAIVPGIPPALTRDLPTEGEEGDIAWVGNASIGFTHDLGSQERHELFGGLSALWNEQATVDETDFLSIDIDVGSTVRFGWADLTGAFEAGHFRLDRAEFLTYYGADVHLARDFLDGRLRGTLGHRTAFEDYDDADSDTPERTGPRLRHSLAARYRLVPRQFIGVEVQYIDKRADEDWREYDGVELSVPHSWLPGRGVLVRNQLAYERDVYGAPNPRVSTRRRNDDQWLYRFTVSLPVSSLLPGIAMPRALRSVRVSGSAQYTSTESNVQNFDHDNVRGELFLSKRFDF